MTVDVSTDIGMSTMAYSALTLLINNLNAAIDAQDAKWNSKDQALCILKQVPYTLTTSDHVQLANFYFGHKPSLIESDPSKLPNVSCLGYRSNASHDQGDHYYGSNIFLGFEAMVVAGPYPQAVTGSGFNSDGEDATNRKVQRMLEAINFVIETNSTLGGVTFQITAPPSTLVTECLRIRPSQGAGDDYYWQMCRLDYTVQKISAQDQF